VLASQKRVEGDKVFVMIRPMGSRRRAAQDILCSKAGRCSSCFRHGRRVHLQSIRPSAGAAEDFNNLRPTSRAGAGEERHDGVEGFQKPHQCIRTTSTGKNVWTLQSANWLCDEPVRRVGTRLQARCLRFQGEGRQNEVRTAATS